MTTPQWIESCLVCTRDVRNDEIDHHGICDECLVALPDEVKRLRAENKRLRAALVPFADAYEGGIAITSDDMRAARDAVGPADVRTVKRG